MEQDLSVEELRLISVVRKKQLALESLTDEERQLDFKRQMKKATRHIYPNSLGVTGHVFKTHELVAASDIKTLPQFISNLDNLCTNVVQATSLAIVPIFGHQKNDGSKNLIGILQLVNKNDGDISAHDIVSNTSTL